MSYRRDYLIRMFEDMTTMVAKVFGLKQEQKYIEAIWELDDLMRKFFGLNSKLINSLPPEDIIEMLRVGGVVEVDKLQTLARLLKEEADVFLAKNELDEGIVRLMKSLHLYLYAALHGADLELQDLPQQIAELKERLKGYELPVKSEKLVLQYEEQQGHFDLAENALYRLLDRHAASPAEAIAFYERLLQYSDEQLEQGGLPRDEVEEGRNAMLQRQ
ncbi:DUF6483 domain-containing protein [Paenibacillus sediminis]|uniref:Tetratricopeptide repeat protein n=1 Tax=Paenibacillus sediminis TaxID=664909 RepID=A0ABS4H4D9_9BACL|nr:DUF6483 family protein [Paenibacillus sediminis]MBP1937117.1 hypothetical protein [Paenibacillus sediminis]